MANWYSVYERGTDRPIIIHGTPAECAAALGITRDSFYKSIQLTKSGSPRKKYEIFKDDPEEADP